MEAFGSYGQKTVIDFRTVNQNLFLITGDTGAGKSTIFDAIVFAIYGEASSGNNKKNGRELQSQFTEYDREPYVEFVFSELSGDEELIYTVRRSPRHVRRKQNKDGVKDVSEKVSLLLPDGTEYPEKPNKKIEEIVGLTKDQFMQITMIAQGEFMEVLRAKSDDKKVIFRKLFHTELYQEIVNELANRKKTIEKEIAIIRTSFQTEVSHIEVPEQYKSFDVLQQLQNKIKTSDSLSIVDMEQMTEALYLLCKYQMEQEKEIGKRLELADAKKAEANDAYIKAETFLKFFDQLDRAEAELEACKQNEALYEANQVLQKQIYDAYEIQVEYEKWSTAQDALKGIEKELNEKQRAYPNLVQAQQNAMHQKKQLEIEKAAEIERFGNVKTQVESARNTFQNIRNTNQQIQKQEVSYNIAEKQAEDARKQFAEFQEKKKEWQAKEDRLKITESKLELLNVQKQNYNNMQSDVKKTVDLQKEINELHKTIELEQNQYQHLSERYSVKHAEYEQYRKAFFNVQAGILAREELKPGVPCPVCGSCDHPAPCQLAEEHKNLTRDKLDWLMQEVDVLRKEQETKANEINEKRTSLQEKINVLQEKLQKLWEQVEQNTEVTAKEMNLKEIVGWMQRWRNEIEATWKQLQADLTELQNAQRFLSESVAKEAELEQLVLQKETDAKDAKDTLELLKHQVFVLESNLTFSSEKEANETYAQAENCKQEKEIAYQEAEKSASVAEQALHATTTLIEKYQAEIPEQKNRLDQLQIQYSTALQQRSMTEIEWKTLVHTYSKEDVEKFQIAMDQHIKRKQEAEAVRESAKKEIAGQSRPDMDALRNVKTNADAEWQRAQEASENVKLTAKINRDVYQKISPKMEERKTRVEEHARLDVLYRALSGNVSGSRMDIETYVQRYYMEQILHAANVRFREMSAGQFELRMYDLEKAGEGKNHGLDLMVYSNVTGKVREVRTLSGGESFMAALALALGMADQIQEKSSAINLDIMFIDEGFGSLDEYSREQAVKVLRDMANGSKLIGIISHVTELKQEIDNQLIVKKDEQGSHVKWQIS